MKKGVWLYLLWLYVKTIALQKKFNSKSYNLYFIGFNK